MPTKARVILPITILDFGAGTLVLVEIRLGMISRVYIFTAVDIGGQTKAATRSQTHQTSGRILVIPTVRHIFLPHACWATEKNEKKSRWWFEA